MCGEVIFVCFEIHKKTNAPCGQDAEFVKIKPDDAWYSHWTVY
jgi:hypothetical protein